MSARRRSLDDSIGRLLDSIFPIFGFAATQGVTQKPTSLTNQGLRHNWP
jgi:hypothetical protein